MKWTLLAALFLWTQPLAADTIHLKDGTSVQGTIMGAGPERIEFNTVNGTMTIPRDRITGIELSPAEAPPAAPPAAVPPPPEAPPPADLLGRKLPAYREAPGFGPGADILAVEFGLSIPVSQVNFAGIGGGNAVNGDVGPLAGLQYLHQFDHHLSLGAEFEYADRSSNDTFSLSPTGEAHIYGDSEIFLAEGRWSLRDQGLARPYILGGLGAHRTSETIDVRPFPGFAWPATNTYEPRRLIDGDLWGFASCVRVGVDFHMDHSTSLGFDLSWLRLSGGTYAATSQGEAMGLTGISNPVHLITLAARLGFSL
jgi:hypothetical protein